MPQIFISDWHKEAAVWVLCDSISYTIGQPVQDIPNVWRVTDEQMKELRKAEVSFHLYGKSDACHNGHYSVCEFERQCTCMCHWCPPKLDYRNEYDVTFTQ